MRGWPVNRHTDAQVYSGTDTRTAAVCCMSCPGQHHRVEARKAHDLERVIGRYVKKLGRRTGASGGEAFVGRKWSTGRAGKAGCTDVDVFELKVVIVVKMNEKVEPSA